MCPINGSAFPGGWNTEVFPFLSIEWLFWGLDKRNAEFHASPMMFEKALGYWDYLWQEVQNWSKRLAEMPGKGSGVSLTKRWCIRNVLYRVPGGGGCWGRELAAVGKLWQNFSDYSLTVGIQKPRRSISVALLSCTSKYSSVLSFRRRDISKNPV